MMDGKQGVTRVQSEDSDEPVRTTGGPSGPLSSFVRSRWPFKLFFLLVFVIAVIQLLLFERAARFGSPLPTRPEVVAGILPVGHFMSLFAWMRGGGWDILLPAGISLILMAMVVSFLFKRGFCGWICPVGTVWELCSAAGRRVRGSNIRLPRWLDVVGRVLRYVIMAAAVYSLVAVPLAAAVGFREIPYMWVADLKIIHLMAEPTFMIVALAAVVISFFFGAVWCRYLCPVGGIYSIIGLCSPSAVHRDAATCIDCHRCSKTCHAFIEPEKTERVWSTECDGCMDCVRVCPVDDCLQARFAGRIRIQPWAWPILLVVVWLLMWGFAKVLGLWDTGLDKEMFRTVINSGLLEQKTPGFFQ